MFFNTLKTLLLLTALSGTLLLMGNLVGGQQGLIIALVIAVIINFGTYFYSEKIALRLYRAKPLDKEKHAGIYIMIDELSRAMNIPAPKLWIIHTPMANAFATGRNPQHASIALTTGILSLLEDYELRGVLAHELAHIKNRDTLVATIAATIAAAIGYLASMLRYAAFWGTVSGTNRRRGNNPILMIFVALLMPIAALLLQLAISRSREYLADQTGADTSHDPLALASALEKLHRHVDYHHLDKNDTTRASMAPLFIVHPFTGKNMLSLFSTHPPMSKRIERLQQMHEKGFTH